jgi:hypothetical protein
MVISILFMVIVRTFGLGSEKPHRDIDATIGLYKM